MKSNQGPFLLGLLAILTMETPLLGLTWMHQGRGRRCVSKHHHVTAKPFLCLEKESPNTRSEETNGTGR
jgi:hypothetical protein